MAARHHRREHGGRLLGRFLVTGLTAGLFSCALAPQAVAQDTSEDGRIVFSADAGFDEPDIYVMEADGSEPVNITNTPGIAERQPSWSRGGTAIAYTRPEDGDTGAYSNDIWRIAANGSGAVNLTDTPGISEQSPDWDPTGDRIAFDALVAGVTITEQYDIFTMAGDGSQRRNLTESDAGEFAPAYSPDGSEIAMEAARVGRGEFRNWEVVKMKADGTGEVNLTNTGIGREDGAPQWSPDGTRIAYMSSDSDFWDVWVMTSDGSRAANLTAPDGGWFPSWSRDGSEIVFESNRETGFSFDVFSVDVTGIELPPVPPPADPLTDDAGTDGTDWAGDPGCTITGTGGPDEIEGTPEDDVICARGGDDEISAGSGRDVILAGAGDDEVSGGRGSDRIGAGFGDDVLRTGDGVARNDIVSGSRGRDLCVADRKDVPVDCEKVRRWARR